VGLFGTLTGLAASLFISDGIKSEADNNEVLEQIKKLHEKLDELKRSEIN